ncbi:MAG: amino acid ABC transporter substrate-binding protein [Actinobacteria bacterium]|nr:amino acid ABC transporter substrate-binding protein [Actinomycetota bacterium]
MTVLTVAALAVLAAGCGKSDSSAPTTTTKDATATTAKGDGGSGAGGTLTICSDIPYEPMEMEATTTKTPSGYTGFDIDLVQQIATKAGRSLVVKVTPFDSIFASMDAGTCDAVVSSVTITDERKANMAFTTPYFDSNQSLMVLKKNAQKFKTIDDLAGKTIGVQSGTTGEEWVNSHKPSGATVKALPGAADLFAALEAGSIDAILQDYPINAYRATKDKNVVITQKIQTDEKYGMAVKKGDTATLDMLDKGLSTAKSDGSYDKLYEKYFGEKPPTS